VRLRPEAKDFRIRLYVPGIFVRNTGKGAQLLFEQRHIDRKWKANPKKKAIGAPH
jgi:hypothetical protein